MQLGMKLILYGLLLLTLLVVVTEGQLKALRRGRIPKGMPEGMTLEEFLESRGQGRHNHTNIRKLARRIKQRLLKSGEKLPDDVDDKFDDMVFTEEQLRVIDEMTAPSGGHGKHSRRKRKVVNFQLFRKWLTPIIHYMVDGTQTPEQLDHIHLAVNHWAEKTCIRFIEGSDDINNYPYIYIMRNDSGGCWSYIGRVNTVGPQILNLASSCFYVDGRYGTIVHELGHALGLVHEHTRDDRESYVTIIQNNIISGKESQFFKWPTGYLDVNITSAVHYDYGSIMHYGTTAFSATGSPTIEPIKSLFSSTIGQRQYLSFWDAYAINLVYCSGACGNMTSPPCQRGGYQDPNKCDSCVCPEGFTGQYCEKDEANTAVCPESGHISLGAERTCIQLYMQSTTDDVICDWHVQTNPGVKIEFWFEYMHLVYFTVTKQCYDFVEIKYMNNLIDRGPRFCQMVSDHFTSNINELMVNFRGYYYSSSYTPYFKLCFKALQETTVPPTDVTSTMEETVVPPTTMTTTVEDITVPPTTMTTTVEDITVPPTIMTTTVEDKTEPPTTEYPEATTNTRKNKKYNRKHENRTKKLNKKLERVFGSTTPSNLPQKRKALRKLLRELLASAERHGEGDSY